MYAAARSARPYIYAISPEIACLLSDKNRASGKLNILVTG